MDAVTATYSGDTTHAASSGSTGVLVISGNQKKGPAINASQAGSMWILGTGLPFVTGGIPGNPIRVIAGNSIGIIPGTPVNVATVAAMAGADAAAHRPVGTRFKIVLSQPATVRLLFTQRAKGRVQGKSCVKQTARNRHKARCSGNTIIAGLNFAAPAGSPVLHFSGRLSRSKILKPGAYTVVITATYADGSISPPRALSFTIVKHSSRR